MKVIEKIKLIETIALELQARYTFNEINSFLAEFQILETLNNGNNYNSKRVYVKDKLRGISIKELKKIADELEISTENIIKIPPQNWQNKYSVKAFISHISQEKAKAKRLRDELINFNIDCFVAHEDIKPSKEWQDEINKALDTMDFFISLHTKGFSESVWCQQEVGFAIGRKVKIIPVKFDEDPKGFIGKLQALLRGKKDATILANDIISILKEDSKTKDLFEEKIESSLRDKDEAPF